MTGGGHRQAGSAYIRQRLEHIHVQCGGIQILLQGLIIRMQGGDLIGFAADRRVGLFQVGIGYVELLPGRDIECEGDYQRTRCKRQQPSAPRAERRV